MKFVITPAYRYALSLGDKVELGFKGSLAFNIGNHNHKGDNYQITTDTFSFPNSADNYTQTVKAYNTGASQAGTQQEQTSWGITPEAAAAIQFTAIPNRLTLNAGLSLTLPGFTTTTTKTTPLQSKTVTEIERADGSVVEYVSATGLGGNSTSATGNEWEDFQWLFGAGFSFLFNDTFSADLAFNGGNITTANLRNVNISQLAVLFTVRR
jgi:hypothetical protein